MVAPADLSTKFALDVQAVNGLRVAEQDRPGRTGSGRAAVRGAVPEHDAEEHARGDPPG